MSEGTPLCDITSTVSEVKWVGPVHWVVIWFCGPTHPGGGGADDFRNHSTEALRVARNASPLYDTTLLQLKRFFNAAIVMDG